jgi:hypothetical protein
VKPRYIPLLDHSRGELCYGVKCTSRVDGKAAGVVIYWFGSKESVIRFVSADPHAPYGGFP